MPFEKGNRYRFQRGTSGNVAGVPTLMLKFRNALQECLTRGDFEAVVGKLKDAAKKGRPWAVKEFLDRTLGRQFSVDMTTQVNIPTRSGAEQISDRNLRNYLICLQTSFETVGSTAQALKASGVKLTDKVSEKWAKKVQKDFHTENPIEDLHLTPRGEERLAYVYEDLAVSHFLTDSNLPLSVVVRIANRYGEIRYPDGLGIFGEDIPTMQEVLDRLQADTEVNLALDEVFGLEKTRSKKCPKKS